jgi:monomeric sarcosine oxidase
VVSGTQRFLARPVESGSRYDVAVVGAGVFGTWTARRLADAGARVVLVEMLGPAHSRASSGGESRVTRCAYGADELYSRWARESLAAWRALESESGLALLHETGVLWCGEPGDTRIESSRATLGRLGIPFEILDPAAIERRWPQISGAGLERALYEPEGGVLMARRAVQALAAGLEARGVTRVHARVAPVDPAAAGTLEALVRVGGGEVRAERYVLAGGPWLPKLVPGAMGERLFATRQEVYFFGVPAADGRFGAGRFPTWLDGDFYGLPDLEFRGAKIACDRHGPAIDPDAADRRPTAANVEEARAALARRFPALAGAPLVEARVCQYENSSNGDLLIDRHPALDNVWLVGCGSGHGFKHGPAVGAEAARQVLEGRGATIPALAYATKGTVQRRSVH